jgi:hypothetical protein
VPVRQTKAALVERRRKKEQDLVALTAMLGEEPPV